jgi:hypothetical protein
MKRLDQGHLPPKLEVPGLTCSSRESNPGELSRKEPFEQLVNSYPEHLQLHMSAQPGENARDRQLSSRSGTREDLSSRSGTR